MSQRVWVITGTSSGIGLAIAQHALSQGDKVIATVRVLNKFPVSLRDSGAHPVALDLADSDAVIKQAANTAIQVYGRVDVLVNNAGTHIAMGPVEEVSMTAIRQLFQENLFGSIAFTQPFITHFRTQRSGHIINVSSVGAHNKLPTLGAYSGTKAALDSFSAALSKEVALYGIKVHIIEPGLFPTNIFAKNPNYTPIEDQESKEVPIPPGLSEVYTDASQGYNILNVGVRMAHAKGKVGDVDALAARVYEIVADTGLARETAVNSHPWLRIPMGSDSGEAILDILATSAENYRAVEHIWRSTDLQKRD